ncbi:hypothetical protein [Aurantimonas sp. Leaf443]|uniref:hypothetical protein n=1 Tax=Aurantimonas sp. Leaf443 TaxID=1736378 RepID=UPI0007004CB8|nr:hypothetical protein [Aurantimonas sp. Leaf443]KQT82456.1 hypothetical protein ASG48_15390 [Aurantimonas sp. Leaf443]
METIFIQAINRLEAVLAGEINALKSGASVNYADLSTRKQQSLLELTRISRGLETPSFSQTLRERMKGLRERLEENRRVVQLHLEATKEIAAILTQAMKDAESDGTYSSSVHGVAVAR